MRPEIHLCVWRRARPLPTWFDDLCRTLVHDVTVVAPVPLRASSESSWTTSLFAGLPASAELEAWVEDVVSLGRLFGELSGAAGVQLSLATVDGDKCRKFHTDYKSLRLVCTYAGPGTEWVADRHVRRSAMGHDDPCIDAANARIVPRASNVRRTDAGSVVLLKGELFPGNRGRGAVHRSPPIRATNQRRIVLTLDAVEEVRTGRALDGIAGADLSLATRDLRERGT